MTDRLDMRFGVVRGIRPFSDKASSPRRKYCIIDVEFPGIAPVRQSVGQFAHHKLDMEGSTVLCLINLGVKNMFGQPSEILILGVPHPNGGVIAGDDHEAQATFLQALVPPSFSEPNAIKPLASYDDWSAVDMRLGDVVGQTDSALTVQLDGGPVSVPLDAPLAAGLLGRSIIIALDRAQPSHGKLPLTAQGQPLFAEPREKVGAGAKVF